VLGFALLGLPGAAVNAGLRYMQSAIQLAFQQRLGLTLHRAYTQNRAYYAASTLGGLTHADQRITEDVERFSASLSELYNHTVKPALDVLLFTRSLARVMGYKARGRASSRPRARLRRRRRRGPRARRDRRGPRRGGRVRAARARLALAPRRLGARPRGGSRPPSPPTPSPPLVTPRSPSSRCTATTS
jgi:hypothetical protein